MARPAACFPNKLKLQYSSRDLRVRALIVAGLGPNVGNRAGLTDRADVPISVIANVQPPILTPSGARGVPRA